MRHFSAFSRLCDELYYSCTFSSQSLRPRVFVYRVVEAFRPVVFSAGTIGAVARVGAGSADKHAARPVDSKVLLLYHHW